MDSDRSGKVAMVRSRSNRAPSTTASIEPARASPSEHAEAAKVSAAAPAGSEATAETDTRAIEMTARPADVGGSSLCGKGTVRERRLSLVMSWLRHAATESAETLAEAALEESAGAGPGGGGDSGKYAAAAARDGTVIEATRGMSA